MPAIKSLLILIGLFSLTNLNAQNQVIKLYNPSFEDIPEMSSAPRGWLDCGKINFPGESPPDTQPGAWKVNLPPSDGGSYLGLVVRDVETWEAVYQRLTSPLIKNTCYSFSIDLCKSAVYFSQSQATDVMASYTTAAVFRVWGSNDYCSNQELLAETEKINNTSWESYEMRFEPTQNYRFIIFEAFYKTPVPFPYNGNILVDNASEIVPIPCNEEETPVIAEVKPEKKPQEAKPKPKPKPKVEKPKEPEVVVAKPTPAPKPPVQPVIKNKLLTDLDAEKLRAGQIVRIKDLNFKADSSRIERESYEVLDEVYDFLNDNPQILVEIGGHTNTLPEHDFCDKLSNDRAEAVVNYLIKKGIDDERLEFKGYGKRKPLAYDKYNKVARRKNQRVEIKILAI